jgi:hypothetical protein
MSLSQLQKQVSYLTYEIQNGAGGGGIQTINDITPDASHNFFLTAGSNITIDASQNGIVIASQGDNIYKSLSESILFSNSNLLTQSSYGIYDTDSNLFYVSNFGNPTSNIIKINETGTGIPYFTPDSTIISRGINIGCFCKVAEFIYATNFTPYIYKIDNLGNATDLCILPEGGSVGICYHADFLYVITLDNKNVYKIDINSGIYNVFITGSGFSYIQDIAFANDGLYISDLGDKKVLTYNTSGLLLNDAFISLPVVLYGGMTYCNNYLFFSNRDDYVILQYNAVDGSLVTDNFAIGGVSYYGCVVMYYNANYFIGDDNGTLIVINELVDFRTIYINATDSSFNPTNAGFYVKPIRASATSNQLYYDPSSNEITYDSSGAIPTGTNYSDYLFYDPTLGSYQSGGSRVHIGSNSGRVSQGLTCVAIGEFAGEINQQNHAISVGNFAGNGSQKPYSIAVGYDAGRNNQGQSCVAIGANCGRDNQGDGSVAIGLNAGVNNQNTNSIILNASGSVLDANSTGCFVAPVRNVATSSMLNYNTATNEISYSTYPTPSIRLLNQSISNAVVSSWNNGASLTIPANSRFQVDVIIATDYNPFSLGGQFPPWVAFSISLYTASRYYGLTLGDPTTTSNYIYCQSSLPNAGGTKPPVKATCNITDLYDLSSDSHFR